MSVRSWAVGVVSSAAVVAGVVAVQSGIAGTSALPVLPHRADAVGVPRPGVELPAPAEVSAPPPSVGALRMAADVVVRRVAPAAHQAEKQSRRSSSSGKGSGADSRDQSDKHDGHSGDESGDESGDQSGDESGGKSGKD